MLSYQHAYHAGNLADVHKHALLAVMLARLTAKPKAMSYIETHAGRGLYDLAAPEAIRTGEAAAGVARVAGWFDPEHPYARAIASTRAAHGPSTYPGSPLIAAALLRPTDPMHLAELHPAEAEALSGVLPPRAHLHWQNGLSVANALCPPVPRRGLLLIDPSYEVKADYGTLPVFVSRIARKWNVGVIALWYPILADQRHAAMLTSLASEHPDALRSEVGFRPAREGHGMVGSGLFVINPPFGLADEDTRLRGLFGGLT